MKDFRPRLPKSFEPYIKQLKDLGPAGINRLLGTEKSPVDYINKKRLFFDIETAPNEGYFWNSGYKLSVPPHNITREKQVICISWKWSSEDAVHSLDWGDSREPSDKGMLEDFIPVLNAADEAIAHNGDRFDLPWLRSRCIYHNIPMFPSYNSIDTLKHFRGLFRNNSNRLDYVGKYLGYGGKTQTSWAMWEELMKTNDPETLMDMILYCEDDVLLLEKIFNRMVNYIPNKTHFGVLNGGEKWHCPECGFYDDITHIKEGATARGTLKHLLRCGNCKKVYPVSNKSLKDMNRYYTDISNTGMDKFKTPSL